MLFLFSIAALAIAAYVYYNKTCKEIQANNEKLESKFNDGENIHLSREEFKKLMEDGFLVRKGEEIILEDANGRRKNK